MPFLDISDRNKIFLSKKNAETHTSEKKNSDWTLGAQSEEALSEIWYLLLFYKKLLLIALD